MVTGKEDTKVKGLHRIGKEDTGVKYISKSIPYKLVGGTLIALGIAGWLSWGYINFRDSRIAKETEQQVEQTVSKGFNKTIGDLTQKYKGVKKEKTDLEKEKTDLETNLTELKEDLSLARKLKPKVVIRYIDGKKVNVYRRTGKSTQQKKVKEQPTSLEKKVKKETEKKTPKEKEEWFELLNKAKSVY